MLKSETEMLCGDFARFVTEVVLVVHLEARLRNQSVGRLRVDPSVVAGLHLNCLPLTTGVASSVNTLHPALVLLNIHLAGIILQSIKCQRSMVVMIPAISPSQHIVKL